MDTFKIIAGKPTIDKDPNAVLDYTIDFTDWCDAQSDTIASHTIAVSGCTIGPLGSSHDSKKVTVWISGGTVGTQASATATVVTAAGRTDDRTIYFKIKQH